MVLISSVPLLLIWTCLAQLRFAYCSLTVALSLLSDTTSPSLSMSSIIVDNNGTRLTFTDSGVPPKFRFSYVTIFAVHGVEFTAGNLCLTHLWLDNLILTVATQASFRMYSRSHPLRAFDSFPSTAETTLAPHLSRQQSWLLSTTARTQRKTSS